MLFLSLLPRRTRPPAIHRRRIHRPPPRLLLATTSSSCRVTTTASTQQCPPSTLALLADHPHPAVAEFPRAGFSRLGDHPLLARAIHGLAVRLALPLSAFHRNTLLAFYFRQRDASAAAAALHLFDEMADRTPSTWYTAVSGCVRCGRDGTAFEMLRGMRERGVPLSGFALASLVTACERRGRDEGIACGAAIHALTHRAGLMGNVYIGTALLHLYGSRGIVSDAQRLFWEMPERNVVSWTALMVALSSNGYLEEALRAYRQMRRDGVPCNANAFATVVSLCGSLENEVPGLQVASQVIVSGLQNQVSVANSLITMFGNLGRVHDAEKLFDRMEEHDTISWNAMISMYSHQGICSKCFLVFSDMRHHGLRPDATTLCSLMSVCASSDHFSHGSGIHSLCLRSSLDSSVTVINALVNMYSAAGKLSDAEFLFWNMSRRDLISWNTMISSYVQNCNSTDALKTLGQLFHTNESPNHLTFSSALGACSSPGALIDGKMVHAIVLQLSLQRNLLVGNSLITMYGKCNSMEDAEKVFQSMPTHDIVSYNVLIGGYAVLEDGTKAMQVFSWMRSAGIKPNYITMINIHGSFASSNDLHNYGRPLHAYIIRTGFLSDEYVANSLITMYAKCGNLESSTNIFNSITNKNIVSWNAIIAANVQLGHGEEALKLFIDMQHAGNKLDRVCLAECLSSCASLASLEEGMQLHGLGMKSGLDSDSYVVNAAMDMYGKCGKMDEMLQVVPDQAIRPQQCWNTLISGYAKYGYFKEAEETFKQMVATGRKPDYVTFVALLSACSHAGLVDKGIDYYNSMASSFGVSPGIKHCVCIVDLLGRLGRFAEAEKFIEEMPVLPNDLIWRSLLSSSRTHKNLEIGRKTAKKLLELDPFDDSAYVLLSNLYATNARWADVDKLRSHMKTININKRPACSWLKLKNEVSTFGIGDRGHKHAEKIYAKLDEMLLKLREVGYIADTSSALHDTDEEQKEQNLWNHSEKLALAYGLIVVPEGSTVRIFKNLRVCSDCHLVFKLVSMVFNREIVLRDPYRFHHFKVGSCSCSDFW
ncbi:pentatricopeptide repeat-containing protein At3g24000, mitochondrial [Oryza sativa Japonica Group]|nr:pentatricopeptide repeat-containing protein At3g24000, mitochondrial [Oryza sativa Japonica Group]XP_025877255.1 pentatricopeptide repeat-containing protein At3g24000, mitochondrial [Oryza sativa Japonica Group]XP_025877256.1 pentatricopeptide repeat-containing protein At3g24000, mitochondrial [Oryza sativa Japonica Group]XP_025877257.1 pentatricopeptide repeat-containing protein At3g24000, mitochondrial [Oryza sativa Japonica Group]XP_025877258.1 pentatricopeptide repeat-containing protein 